MQKPVIVLFFLFSFQVFSQEQKLVILHTNDLHSNLTGFGPESDYSPLSVNDDQTRGGFARLQTLIQQSADENTENNLILDAGDFLMGTLFHPLEEETGFQLRLMKMMGYDYITLGNHEFDFGPESLANTIQSALDNGAIPSIILSNIIFSDETGDDKLEDLYHQGIIRPYHIVDRGRLKIGIIGLIGENAAEDAPASNPARFGSPVRYAKKLVRLLKNEEQADIIICLSHSGIHRNEKGEWEGEDIALARKAKDIDVIISGHTHVETPEAIQINNTLIVQSGYNCRNMGRLELHLSGYQITGHKYQLIPVNDAIAGDESINNMVEQEKQLLTAKYLNKLNLSYDNAFAETSFDLVFDHVSEKSNLGAFIADAVHYYISSSAVEPADVTMIASGLIRENLLKGTAGLQTVPDIFRIVNLGKGDDDIPGYPVSKLYVTARELKKLMEVLLLMHGSSDDYFFFFSGIRVYYNPKKFLLHKIQKIELNGKVVDTSKSNNQLISISANAYLLNFVGLVQKYSHGLVKLVPKDKEGIPYTNMKETVIDFDDSQEGVQEGKEWLAIIAFLNSFKDINGNGIPDIPEYYKDPEFALVKTGSDL
ncbi:MAG: bifunctional metallophosphatase/5'-nucleotidase [Bacteroidales bacterium]|nr:bifunctional metallophosphatase/5'-nucleotidase [Bacteroidales bacterium]